jgi:hypothetical protein
MTSEGPVRISIGLIALAAGMIIASVWQVPKLVVQPRQIEFVPELIEPKPSDYIHFRTAPYLAKCKTEGRRWVCPENPNKLDEQEQ